MSNNKETLQKAVELYELKGIHETAEMFPLMSEEEYAEFVDDIRSNGFMNPVKVTDDLVVIDGRNRLCASVDLAMDVDIERLNPADVLNYVISENLHRRHLTTSQRSAIAVEIKERFAKEAKERQLSGLKQYQDSDNKKEAVLTDLSERSESQKSKKVKEDWSRKKASDVVKVGEVSVQKAEKVKRVDPELYERMKEGKVKSVDSAYKSAIETEEKLKAVGEVVDNLNDAVKKNKIICHDYEGNEYEISSNGKPKFNQSNDSIPWADWTWNPVTGCLGECPYCYAREIAENSKFKRAFPAGFTPLFRSDRLDAPISTKINVDPERPESRRVFVCPMADLFGYWIPLEWIKQVIEATKQAPELEYLYLTKYPFKYLTYDFPDNSWLGVTVDAQSKVEYALDVLGYIDFYGVRWLSFEPLIEPIKADFSCIDCIVIGAQSGTKQPNGTIVDSFTPKFEWVVDLVAQAKSVGCAVYMKQNLLGKVSSQYPGMQLIQEYPTINTD